VKVSYKKLLKLLIDRELKKRDLSDKANVSVATLTKLSKGENVNVDVLVRVCSALECDFSDIMELVPDTANGADS
jgi:DNA-binding Xre family transcriptional regulator